MISALLTSGIGFGGVHYLPTHGLSMPTHRIFRALITGSPDSIRPYSGGGGGGDVFRETVSGTGGGGVFR
jgi:hypothetical protein